MTKPSVENGLKFVFTVIAMVCTANTYAQQDRENTAVVSAAELEVEKYSTLGTRGFFRSSTESAVTLDIIEAEELRQQGETDMTTIISRLIPSYNVQDHPNINDASSLLHPANLRGLSSDSYLVLVNGKRRHRSAIINFLGGGLSDGAQGPDLSVIPVSAIRQVEVLRGGASAQYGSDAIAGVLNFALKEDSEGASVEVRHGGYYAGDGNSWQLSGNWGTTLTNNGFTNLSYEYKQADTTSRTVMRDDVIAMMAAGNIAVEPLAQKFGDPKTKFEHKFFLNSGLDLGDDDRGYLFANFADREVTDSGFFFRSPNGNNGVYTSADGNRLVADLTGEANCPHVTATIDPNSVELISLLNNPDCFVFNELYPGGFTPQFGGRVKDASVVIGRNGTVFEDIYFDLSAAIGQSRIDYNLRNTLNPSYGPNSPLEFYVGSYKQTEKNLNLDASREIDVRSFSAPVNLAWGFEYKHETFEIIAGQDESWMDGGLAEQGFSIGSNGFPGFQDIDAGSWSRYNTALYTDIELYLTDKLTFTTAFRFEDYSDFGSKLTGKIASVYHFDDQTAIRAAVGTGFRAPTVGQSNVRNVTSTFGPNGLEDVATLPPTNPVSQQVGAVPLDAEESLSLSIGFVGAFDSGLYLTVDYFNIEVTDRISQTSILPLTMDDTKALMMAGVTDAENIRRVKYFTNDFDTTTQGIDVVAKYNLAMMGGVNNITFAYNWTDTNVDKFTPSVINDVKISNLESNLPQHRAILSNKFEFGKWHALARANFYGSYTEHHLRRPSQRINAGAELTFDFELGYQFTNSFNLTVGAQNIFDNDPDQNPYATSNGAEFPVTSPMGINGGFYYVRGGLSF